MHERKMTMNDLADGFIILPGGFGTMEEFFEILTWAQLGLHKKPIGVLNCAGFYNGLTALVRHMRQERFLSEKNESLILISESIDDLLEQMHAYEAPEAPKWIQRENT